VDEMLAVHGDAVSASPRLLLPALIQLSSLYAQKVQLAAESEALIVAQADAVRKLAATNTGTNNSVVGSAANFLRGKLRAERPDQFTSTIPSSGHVHSARDDAMHASGQQLAGVHIAYSAFAQANESDQGCRPSTCVAKLNSSVTSQTCDGPSLGRGVVRGEYPDRDRIENAIASAEGIQLVAAPGCAVGQRISGAATGTNGGGGICKFPTVTAVEGNASPTCCAADRSSDSTCTCASLAVPKRGAGSLGVGQSGETRCYATTRSGDMAISVPDHTYEVDRSQHSVATEDSSRKSLLMKQSSSVTRNAKAAKYVDTLLGRANRDKIPELEARQAVEYFEAAKAANGVEDYKAACSYFETSFLLNPKLTTLISTANMHLKLRNPTVAAEIYMRLLQNPSVPQREREVALRKLAVCETMLGTPREDDSHES